MLVRFVVSNYQALSAPIDFEILNSAQRLIFCYHKVVHNARTYVGIGELQILYELNHKLFASSYRFAPEPRLKQPFVCSPCHRLFPLFKRAEFI